MKFNNIQTFEQILLAPSLSLKTGILQHVGRMILLISRISLEAESRIGLGVVRIAQGGVSFIIEGGIGQTQASNEPPHLTVAPVQDGMDSHHTRPISIGGRKVADCLGS